VSHKGKPAVRFKDTDGKTVLAFLTRQGNRCRVASPIWYGQYTDADGNRQRVALSENKVAAEQKLAELVRKSELGRAGLRDPYEKQRTRPLEDHLTEYRRELEARDNAPVTSNSQSTACSPS
jgi:hypothetical protein